MQRRHLHGEGERGDATKKSQKRRENVRGRKSAGWRGAEHCGTKNGKPDELCFAQKSDSSPSRR